MAKWLTVSNEPVKNGWMAKRLCESMAIQVAQSLYMAWDCSKLARLTQTGFRLARPHRDFIRLTRQTDGFIPSVASLVSRLKLPWISKDYGCGDTLD